MRACFCLLISLLLVVIALLQCGNLFLLVKGLIRLINGKGFIKSGDWNFGGRENMQKQQSRFVVTASVVTRSYVAIAQIVRNQQHH
jgi:hypothetical protein